MQQLSRRIKQPLHVHKPSKRRKPWYASTVQLLLVATTACVMFFPYFVSRFVDNSGGEASYKRTSGESSIQSPVTNEVGIQTQSTPAWVQGVSPKSHVQSNALDQQEKSSSLSCAICFFGLPRSFKILVLQSIIQNVLVPNRANRCDIYVHYYDVKTEGKSRSGVGGVLDTDEIWLLQDAVDEIYNNGNATKSSAMKPRVQLSIIKDTNETFWYQHSDRIHRYMNENGEDGNRLYWPWMAKSYDNKSVINLIKQWHSIQSVFQLMENTKAYDRVAMLRNDVVFVTPFDVWTINGTRRDTSNHIVSVPNWARFPVNDRMVVGPTSAVKIWATERFERLETHVRTYPEPGYGLHSERFLDHSIFPAIREELGYEVTANPEICFFRARADGSCWINDCATRNGAALGFRKIDTQKLVEDLVGRKCIRSKYTSRIVQLQCTPES